MTTWEDPIAGLGWEAFDLLAGSPVTDLRPLASAALFAALTAEDSPYMRKAEKLADAVLSAAADPSPDALAVLRDASEAFELERIRINR
ncbi:hypothetical protein [Mycolicibacterium llatzerense]|uniref:Uncharacterized protein n=1 Tax=Mycolicibacterium llatzerense TaxID=280871 RepID=A0A0D1JPB2_9MYCO|nr:hypothetical protein [Mycolicibacterium llatzerense]KIU14414.1 hypothetical protein TL10_24310 [Mycolicibacterium llatzerense]MCT7371446.1 hypothetical protein [Mycolicibacterium llatzerense]